jgi:pyruvate/2-oxoglutarate dehydrogenase complex dihydrolipoamide acyltransferase (E2) component
MTRTFADQDASDAAARRRLRILAVVLFTLLVCSLAISAALWVALRRARENLATAEPAHPKPAVASRPAPAAEAPPAPPAPAVTATPATPPAAAPPAEDRLLILISVGTRHYAEKQLRLLRQRCRAPLAVYLQRRGRCGWTQCFAVAAREADLDLARGCGATKGKSMRERADFVLIQ